jgi:adenylate cyclase
MKGYRGDWPACLASAALGIAIASDSGSVQTLAWNRCVHGWALAHVGEAEKGEAELLSAIASSKAIMGQVALPQLNAMMAEVLLLRGHVAGAEAWLTRAAAFEHSHEDRFFSAEVRRLAAVCAARHARLDEARDGFHAAMALARSQGAATFELRAALDLADLDRERAYPLVLSALSSFPEPAPCDEMNAASRVLERAGGLPSS